MPTRNIFNYYCQHNYLGFTMITGNVFLSYDHQNREYKEINDPAKFEKIISENPSDLSNQLESLSIDGLLIFQRDKKQWNLIFRKNLGLVAQRTARRQADTISRSGFLLKNGERVGVRCTLVQLTPDNIGDLNKSVQQKYINTDLKGYLGDSRNS